MTETIKYPDPATGAATDFVIESNYVTEFWFRGGEDGTATAGTITILVKGPGSTNFETPASSTIDIAAPQRLEVTGTIGQVQISVAGFAGTASSILIEYTGHTP